MSVNLKSLIGKLNDTTRGALEGAAGLCLSRTHYDVEVEHFLLKLLDASGSDAVKIFHQFSIDTSRLQKELERSLDKLKSGNARTPAISPSVLKMLTEGWTTGSIDFGATQMQWIEIEMQQWNGRERRETRNRGSYENGAAVLPEKQIGGRERFQPDFLRLTVRPHQHQ